MFCGLQSNKCRKDTPATVLGRSLWRAFERFFGLENESVESVKMKVETRSGYSGGSHISFLCAAYNFGLLNAVILKPFCRAAET